MKLIRLLFISATLACLAPLALAAEPVDARDKETAECRKHLEKIYDAIQEYRKEHKKLPDYLSDLVPKLISDTSLFFCPKGQREKAEYTTPGLADPKLDAHYIYEFSARDMGDRWGGGKMNMVDWKTMQMAVVGGIVPIVRCHQHNPVLNVSFDGRFYESQTVWEQDQAHLVDFEDLVTCGIRLRLAHAVGAANEEAMALDRITYTATKVNRIAGFDQPKAQKKSDPDLARTALEGAERAARFQNEYPKSGKLSEAQSNYRFLLFTAARLGNDEARRKADKIIESASGTQLPESERLEIRMIQIYTEATDRTSPSFEQRARALIREFPKQPEAYIPLLEFGQTADEQRRTAIAEEILKIQDAPDAVKGDAKSMLRRVKTSIQQ